MIARIQPMKRIVPSKTGFSLFFTITWVPLLYLKWLQEHHRAEFPLFLLQGAE
jgi:hypothetical protein